MVNEMSDNKVKNGEILFIYESKMGNPNGDPDNENMPRMDYSTNTNLVSDVRLKRYIRDYFIDTKRDDQYDIFVKRKEKVQNATERADDFRNSAEDIIKKCVDIRMFGATIAIKGKKGDSDQAKEKGSSIQLTGPIQLTWGYSLNEVELLNSYTITTTFASEAGKTAGSMGKDYRVYYSLIAFYGVISAKRAEKSKLTPEDLKQFDEAMIKSIPSQATRTKIGQQPLLYIRTEYNESNFVGDLRDYLTLDNQKNPLRSMSDFSLNLEKLVNVLESRTSCDRVNYWKHSGLNLVGTQFKNAKYNKLDSNE
jgi:CRISPR-associated protein Csh2